MDDPIVGQWNLLRENTCIGTPPQCSEIEYPYEFPGDDCSLIITGYMDVRCDLEAEDVRVQTELCGDDPPTVTRIRSEATFEVITAGERYTVDLQVPGDVECTLAGELTCSFTFEPDYWSEAVYARD